MATRWFVLSCVWASVLLTGLPIATVRAAPKIDHAGTVVAANRQSPAADCALPAPLTPLSICIRDSRNVFIGQGAAPECQDVVLDRSYTGAEALGLVQIRTGGRLFIPDRTVTIETEEIDISGLLQAGTANCPIGSTDSRNHVTIVLTGSRPAVCSSPER